MFLLDVLETIDDIATAILIMKILFWVVIISILGSILYFVIRATCRYQARQNAKAFDYDYLAERTAEEVCKRMVILEKQKEAAYKGATGSAEDQSRGDRDWAPEQAENWQA